MLQGRNHSCPQRITPYMVFKNVGIDSAAPLHLKQGSL